MRKILAALGVWLALAGAAAAQICSAVPFTFTANTTIHASQVNSNFSGIVSCVNGNSAPLASPTFTGTITGVNESLSGTLSVGGTSTLSSAATLTGAGSSLNITTAAGNQRQINYQTAGTNRWIMLTDNAAESGSNAGSNFFIQSIADGGGFLANPFGITRATGVVNFSVAPTVAGSVMLRSYLAGLGLSNDGGSPNTVLDIAAGTAADTSNLAMISLGAFTKSTAGAWTSGTGNNGMGQGLTIAATTWYDACLANNGGTPDVFFDTAVSGQTPCAQHRPNAISDTKIRRLGSFLTDGAAHIIAMVCLGDECVWKTPVNDINTATLSTVATLFSLTVPPGVQVNARMRVTASNGASSISVLLNSPDETSTAANTPTGNASMRMDLTTTAVAGEFNIRTNTAGQIRAVSSASGTTLQEATYGWTDTHGRFN